MPPAWVFDGAIYNDVDQVYLADPGELFDTDLGSHGFVSIGPPRHSVMLLDCERMAAVWSLQDARHKRRKTLEASATAEWGALEPAWNARDEEYRPGDSKVLHYTTIHAQPWQPFPERYAYQRNPVAHVWFGLERAADQAAYRMSAACPEPNAPPSVWVLTAENPATRPRRSAWQTRSAGRMRRNGCFHQGGHDP